MFFSDILPFKLEIFVNIFEIHFCFHQNLNPNKNAKLRIYCYPQSGLHTIYFCGLGNDEFNLSNNMSHVKVGLIAIRKI